MTFAEKLLRHQARLDYYDGAMAAALDISVATYRAWRRADPKRIPPLVAQEGTLARLAKLKPVSKNGYAPKPAV